MFAKLVNTLRNRIINLLVITVTISETEMKIVGKKGGIIKMENKKKDFKYAIEIKKIDYKIWELFVKVLKEVYDVPESSIREFEEKMFGDV